MAQATPTPFWQLLVAIALTAAALFGPRVHASSSWTTPSAEQWSCGHVFLVAKVIVEEPPVKTGFFGDLVAKFKRPLKTTYIDPQVEIRLIQKHGFHSQAQAKIEALEHALRTNEIVKTRLIGEGQSGARLATFSDGTFAVLKKANKYYENLGAEVAAFKLNMFFGDFVGVPVTVLREYRGEMVSVQVHLYDSGHAYPTELPKVYRQNLLFFDFMIDNPDRTSKNLLFDSRKYLSAIDNGYSFRSAVALEQDPNGPYTNVTYNTAWSMRFHQQLRKDAFVTEIDLKKAKEWIIQWLPQRQIYEKMKETPDQVFIDLLEPYVGLIDAQAFIKRKHFFIEATEEWLAEGHHYPRHGDY